MNLGRHGYIYLGGVEMLLMQLYEISSLPKNWITSKCSSSLLPKKNKPKLHKVESISFNDWLYAEGESSFKWDLSFPSAQRFQFHAIEWLCRGWFFPPAPTPPGVGKNFGGKPLSTAIERDLVGHHGILALRSPTCPSNDWTLNTELGFH